MDPVQAPGVYEGVANVIAAVMLLLEFGMLRQALARDQIRLYAAQSALISVLAIVIAADRNLPDLYVLAALSAALKVVAVPLVMRRLLGRTDADEGEEAPGVAGSQTLSPASAVLAGIVLAAIGFFCFGAMQIRGSAAPATALSIAGAMVLVAFGLMIVRRDVASQAIGFFSLENAISLAALDLEELRGLRGRRTPWSGFGLAVGSLTLAGLPPTVGFVSEWFLLESLMQQFRVPGLGYRSSLV